MMKATAIVHVLPYYQVIPAHAWLFLFRFTEGFTNPSVGFLHSRFKFRASRGRVARAGLLMAFRPGIAPFYYNLSGPGVERMFALNVYASFRSVIVFLAWTLGVVPSSPRTPCPDLFKKPPCLP